MAEPIDESYFNWLCAKVLQTDFPVYYDLMRLLYTTEFVWLVPADSNRAEDGMDLRHAFLTESRATPEPVWMNSACSILEALIAFANRAAFQTDDKPSTWFWEFLTNLGLSEFRQISSRDREIVCDILDTFVFRTYNDSGHGGMFPLRWPKRDQREVEIWYQFCDYLEDQGRI